MLKIVFFLFCLILIPYQTRAADWGLVFWVYLCNNTEITEKTVNACILQYPELKLRGAAALDSWRLRDANSIQRGKELCDADLHKHFTTETQLAKARVQVEKLTQEHLDELRSRILNGGITVCQHFLTILEDNKGDFPRIFE